nr:DUF397 domain-containing protein [Kibdelosporangium sp. MJ126-NF4]CEL22838.1 hypothetical protein [Kibdelosporangium sp. MJ126-NF4]CTQ89978.1 hypothetical protein [Kibdelosporangium sp. MJ126-NF4]
MTDSWTWRKSSRSAGNGQCVEVGTHPRRHVIAIRDSKLGDTSPILMFAPDEVRAFVHGIKAGEFDDLV